MLTSLDMVKSFAVDPFNLEKLPEFRKFLLVAALEDKPRTTSSSRPATTFLK